MNPSAPNAPLAPPVAAHEAWRKRKLRVLQLGKFIPILGGVEKVMYDLTLGLSRLPEPVVHCDMMCAASEGPDRILPLPGSARLFSCRTWRKVNATMLSPSMIRNLRRRCADYDIIHIHHPDPMACLALMLSGFKGKVVLHWHSDIHKQKFLLRFYRPLQNWLLRRAAVVVGTTPVYLAESPHLKNVQHKTCCLPIGVAPVKADPQGAEAVRRRYGGRKIIFSLGRLVAYKGYEYLVEAARHLPPDYVVLIGGSGPLDADLAARIERGGLADRVKLLGRIPDEELPAYYGACTLFCLSSIHKSEAFAIVQIEAMSCRKPVVATRIPQSGVAWVNAHGVSGLNVPPADAPALAEAILRITADAETYRQYAEGAYKRYLDVFTQQKAIDNLLDIYAKL